MFVSIREEVLTQFQQQTKKTPEDKLKQPLYGRFLDERTVIQVLSLEAEGNVLVGYAVYGNEPMDQLDEIAVGSIGLCLHDDELNKISVWAYEQAGWQQPIEYEIVRVRADFHSRLQGLFDTTYLLDKTVTVIGLGTGGGAISLELAKNGVGNFRLVDFDRLEVHNVSRHVCGLKDLGRYKTKSLADLLTDNHPQISVTTYEFDVLKDEAQLKQVVLGSDLVVAATDSERSKRLINRVCWPLKIPALYGSAYDRAFGGDIIRIIPPDMACYECAFKEISELFETAPRKSEIAYTSEEDVSKVVAEPGLGVDVGFINLIMIKVALLTLLRGSDSTLEDLPADWIMWGNQPIWLFEKPLESIFLELPQNPACPVCRHEAYIAQELGMSEAEAEAAGKDILATVPEATVSLPKQQD